MLQEPEIDRTSSAASSATANVAVDPDDAWDSGSPWSPWAFQMDPVGFLELDVVWEDVPVDLGPASVLPDSFVNMTGSSGALPGRCQDPGKLQVSSHSCHIIHVWVVQNPFLSGIVWQPVSPEKKKILHWLFSSSTQFLNHIKRRHLSSLLVDKSSPLVFAADVRVQIVTLLTIYASGTNSIHRHTRLCTCGFNTSLFISCYFHCTLKEICVSLSTSVNLAKVGVKLPGDYLSSQSWRADRFAVVGPCRDQHHRLSAH